MASPPPDAALGRFAGTAELTALCDSNPTRLELALAQSRRDHGAERRGYAAEAFARMLGLRAFGTGPGDP